jgi:hypothetical protein
MDPPVLVRLLRYLESWVLKGELQLATRLKTKFLQDMNSNILRIGGRSCLCLPEAWPTCSRRISPSERCDDRVRQLLPHHLLPCHDTNDM